MSRGLGRNQVAILVALYGAGDGEKEYDLKNLLEEHDLAHMIPGYANLATQKLRSPRATVRRAFRSLESRGLVECTTRIEQHPCSEWTDTTIERLYLRITAAGVSYVESKGLYATVDRSSARRPDAHSRRAQRWNDQYHRDGQATVDGRERRRIEAALQKKRSWPQIADQMGYADPEAVRQRYLRMIYPSEKSS